MTILVTGGSGFLGAWIVRRLQALGLHVRVFDRRPDPTLLRLLAGDAKGVDWIGGDIADGVAVRAAARGSDRIIHSAGLLTPDCAKDPVRGALVKVIGTLNVFESALAEGHPSVVYTSTAAVFGPRDGHTPNPRTQYGSFKLACEGAARAYWEDRGIASIGFRPYIVYGPGRETGASAGPTLACRAAALGESYTITYGGRSGLVFVDDVAAAYEAAVTSTAAGAHVFNLAGTTVSNERVIDEIRHIVPKADLSVAGPPLPIAPELDPGNLASVFPGLPQTPLPEGIRRTIEFYRQQGH